MRSENPATQQRYTIEKILKLNSSTAYSQAFSKPTLLLEISTAFTDALEKLSRKNKALIAQFNEGVDLYNASYVLGGNQLLSDKKYRRNLKKIKKMLKEKSLKEVSTISTDILKEKLKRDFILVNHILKSDETWHRLEEGLEGNRISEVKEKWLLLAKFSHFTLDGLLNVIEILAHLDDLLDLIIEEFQVHKTKLNMNVQKSYPDELMSLRDKIRREKKHIANSLYERCQSAMLNDGSVCQSPFIDLLNSLLALGCVNKKFVEAMLSVQPKQENIDFAHAYYYASKYASTSIKEEVNEKNLLLTYDKTPITLTYKKIDNNQYIIPHSLIKYIPNKKPYWFSLGRKQRYQFFKDKGPLILKLIAQQNKKIQPASLEDLLSNPTWQTMVDLSSELEIANQHVNKLIKPRFSIFKRTSINMHKEWQAILIGQQSKICKAQIDYLSQLVNQPRPLSELFEKPYMDNDTRQKIQETISELSKSQAFGYLSDEDKEKFYPIQNELIARCKNDQAIEAVNSILVQLASNLNLDETDFNSTQQYLFKLSPSRLNKHFKNNKENIERIFENTTYFFNNVIKNNNFEGFSTVFSQQVKMLKTFLHISEVNTIFTDKLPIHLDNFLIKYEAYLKNQTQASVLDNKIYLEQLEDTVNAALMAIPDWKDKVQSFALLINSRLLLEKGIKPVLGSEALKLAKDDQITMSQSLKESRKERVANLAKLNLPPIKIASKLDNTEIPNAAETILENAKMLDKSTLEACKRFQKEREIRLSRLSNLTLLGKEHREEHILTVSNIVPNI